MPMNVGFASAAGYGLESTWSTAVAVTNAIKYLSDSMDQTRAKIVRATNRGQGGREANSLTHKVAGGNLTGLFTYELADPWLTHFLGTFTVDVGGDFYTLIDQVTDGLTVAIDRVVAVHEYEGYVIDAMTLAGSPDIGVTFEWQGTAKQRLITGTTNAAAAVAALAEPAGSVLFHEMTLRVGDMADALAAGDDLSVSQFSLAVNRNKVAQAVNATTRLQSKENGHRDSMLTITLPRYEVDTFLGWEDAGTPLQGNLIFTDGTSTKDLRISHMTVESVPISQSDDSQAEMTVTLRLHENGSAANVNTGFDFVAELALYEI